MVKIRNTSEAVLGHNTPWAIYIILTMAVFSMIAKHGVRGLSTASDIFLIFTTHIHLHAIVMHHISYIDEREVFHQEY